MIKTPNPKSFYCAKIGCKEHAVGMLQVTEHQTGCKFVIPICDYHTYEQHRQNFKRVKTGIEVKNFNERLSRLEVLVEEIKNEKSVSG